MRRNNTIMISESKINRVVTRVINEMFANRTVDSTTTQRGYFNTELMKFVDESECSDYDFDNFIDEMEITYKLGRNTNRPKDIVSIYSESYGELDKKNCPQYLGISYDELKQLAADNFEEDSARFKMPKYLARRRDDYEGRGESFYQPEENEDDDFFVR